MCIATSHIPGCWSSLGVYLDFGLHLPLDVVQPPKEVIFSERLLKPAIALLGDGGAGRLVVHEHFNHELPDENRVLDAQEAQPAKTETDPSGSA